MGACYTGSVGSSARQQAFSEMHSAGTGDTDPAQRSEDVLSSFSHNSVGPQSVDLSGTLAIMESRKVNCLSTYLVVHLQGHCWFLRWEARKLVWPAEHEEN